MINGIDIVEDSEAERICMICLEETTKKDSRGLIVKNSENHSTFHTVHNSCLLHVLMAASKLPVEKPKVKE